MILRHALRGLTTRAGGQPINLEGWVAGADSVNLLTSRLADLQARYVTAQGFFEQAQTSLGTRVSSLYLVLLAPLVTRSVVMRDGRVAYDGPPVDSFADVHAHAHHPVAPPADHHPQVNVRGVKL